MADRLGTYVSGSDSKFRAYMAKVDAAVEKRTGLSAMDLVDIDYFSLFSDGVPPARAAVEAIRESGGM